MLHGLRGYSTQCVLRTNNLQPKEKRLIIVFSTVDIAEQGAGRAEFVFIRRIPLAVYCATRGASVAMDNKRNDY